MEELIGWTKGLASSSFQLHDCLSLFDATQGVTRCWQKLGFVSESYDIKHDPKFHDITSERGFRRLLEMAAGLLDFDCFTVLCRGL